MLGEVRLDGRPIDASGSQSILPSTCWPAGSPWHPLLSLSESALGRVCLLARSWGLATEGVKRRRIHSFTYLLGLVFSVFNLLGEEEVSV